MKKIDPYDAAMAIFLAMVVLGFVTVAIHAYLFPQPHYSPLQLRMTEVARCEATEEFTRDQCVILVGGE